MKSHIGYVISKLPRYIPSTLMLLLVIFLNITFREYSLEPFVTLYLPLLASDYLLEKGKIWGIVPGILFGIYTILDDLKPPRVGPTVAWIGIVLIVYYVICGICVFVKKIKSAKNN